LQSAKANDRNAAQSFCRIRVSQIGSCWGWLMVAFIVATTTTTAPTIVS
jgi:hypothetical protein